MITEDYVSFETAKLLKEKGFDEPCLMCYNSDKKIDNYGLYRSYKNSDVFALTAPTLQMTMKWLREVHKIGIFPTTFYRHTATFDGHNYGSTLVNLETFEVIGNFEDCTFPADTYEESCESAIKYCLENLI